MWIMINDDLINLEQITDILYRVEAESYERVYRIYFNRGETNIYTYSTSDGIEAEAVYNQVLEAVGFEEE